MAELLIEKNNRYFVKEVKLLKSPENMKGLFNDVRWEILKFISEKPAYPANIAKHLKLHEQKVYYHMKQLEKNGLISVVMKKEHSGAQAKYYAPKSHAFALELPGGEETILDNPIKKEHQKFNDFFNPLITGGKFNAKIVIGSPDPHGPHQVRARDGHYALDIAAFLGQYAALPKTSVVSLDTDIKSEKNISKNLIVVGGILTNLVAKDINPHMLISFDETTFPYRKIISKKTDKTYTEDNLGVICKSLDPKNGDKHIILLAGNTNWGTKAAIYALTRMTDEIFANYNKQDAWGLIVQGFDLDGDGKMDSVKVIE
ncbi:helix-turn-helix domain-containing protein [archaeon]|nr:helix-turn-helix domain-containing protein [archaeon]